MTGLSPTGLGPLSFGMGMYGVPMSYMEDQPLPDLREVGEKAIDNVSDLGAAQAGDLVLGIGEIINDLRTDPEQFREKLDHLEGLFREFAYGEQYELRNDRTEEPENDFAFGMASSGMVVTNNSNITLSGCLPQASFSFGNSVQSQNNQLGAQQSPIKTPGPAAVVPVDDDSYECYDDFNQVEWIHPDAKVREELKAKRTREGSTSKPKKFKPAWWKKKISEECDSE